VRAFAIDPGAGAPPEALRMFGSELQRGAQVGLVQVVQRTFQQVRCQVVGDGAERGIQAVARRGMQRGQRLQRLQREPSGGLGTQPAHREAHRAERDQRARLRERRVRAGRERLRPQPRQVGVAGDLRGDRGLAKDRRRRLRAGLLHQRALSRECLGPQVELLAEHVIEQEGQALQPARRERRDVERAQLLEGLLRLVVVQRVDLRQQRVAGWRRRGNGAIAHGCGQSGRATGRCRTPEGMPRA
jgi:hypothetical protein